MKNFFNILLMFFLMTVMPSSYAGESHLNRVQSLLDQIKSQSVLTSPQAKVVNENNSINQNKNLVIEEIENQIISKQFLENKLQKVNENIKLPELGPVLNNQMKITEKFKEAPKNLQETAVLAKEQIVIDNEERITKENDKVIDLENYILFENIKKLQNERKENKATIKELEKQILELRDARFKYDQLKKMILKYEQELSTFNDIERMRNLNEENLKIVNQKKNLEEKLQTAKAQSEKLSTDLKALQNDIAKKNDEMKKNLHELEKEKAIFKNELDLLKVKFDKSQQEIEDLKIRSDYSQTRVQELETKLKANAIEQIVISVDERDHYDNEIKAAENWQKQLVHEALKGVNKHENETKTAIEKQDKHYNLGVVFEKTGMYKEAAEEYLKCLTIDPNDADAHYNLAIIYDDNLHDYENAIKHYKKYLSLRPDDDVNWQVKQWLLYAEQKAALERKM